MSASLGSLLLARLPLSPTNLALLGGVIVGLILLGIAWRILFRRKSTFESDSPLAEDLAALGPPPSGPRHYYLHIRGQPGRLRYVVLAPMGKRSLGKPETTLELVCRGLGEVAMDDKPRVRLWPPQLSATGFAPSFFRVTRRPGRDGQPSRWVLLAGPARAGGTPILLGLAVQMDTPTDLGQIVMKENDWNTVLDITND